MDENRLGRCLELVAKADTETLTEIERMLNGANRRPNDRPALVRIKEAPFYLGVSRSTVRRMIEAGILVPVEIAPNIHRLRVSDLERLARDGFRSTKS